MVYFDLSSPANRKYADKGIDYPSKIDFDFQNTYGKCKICSADLKATLNKIGGVPA
jgi:hypothetical protein